MTEVEKKTPVTMEVLMTVLEAHVKEIEAISDNLNKLNKTVDAYHATIESIVNSINDIINNFEQLRAFVIALYAEQTGLSVKMATENFTKYCKEYDKFKSERSEQNSKRRNTEMG